MTKSVTPNLGQHLQDIPQDIKRILNLNYFCAEYWLLMTCRGTWWKAGFI